jgi:hypothetical protein
MAAAQVNAGLQRRRQPRIARHHQNKPPLPADPREVSSKHPPSQIGVMPQNHPRSAARQGGNGGAGIGQAPVVREQPKAGKAFVSTV